MRDIVFLDLETTGLNEGLHDIIEIGALRVDARSLEVVSHLNVRVHPTRLDVADPRALQINGFTVDAWQDARSLYEALRLLSPLLSGASLAGHNVAFDRRFLVEGFKRACVPFPNMHYHTIDTISLAWPLYASGEVNSLSLDTVCGHFDIERPSPHRALNDAKASLEVARRMRSLLLPLEQEQIQDEELDEEPAQHGCSDERPNEELAPLPFGPWLLCWRTAQEAR